MENRRNKTLVLFNYDWDAIAFRRLARRWPQAQSGFDLFSFPSNTRLAWFDMERFSRFAAMKARLLGARAVVSNHEQFGALTASLVAEELGLPGTPVSAVLACQHKLYARQVLQEVVPEANVSYKRLDSEYGGEIPSGLQYPAFVKPVKAAFSVLAKQVGNRQELQNHTRFGPWERWVIHHLVEPFDRVVRDRLPEAGTSHSLMLETPQRGPQYCLDGYVFNGEFRRLGVVDSLMYPGTSAFMRFDYPSRLSEQAQAQAAWIAERFLQAVGYSHGLFNMEFVQDPQTGQLKVIEFNPRMASQFSDLYARVDGIDVHEIALALSHDIDPATLVAKEPVAGCASSFVYRTFDLKSTVAMPSAQQVHRFNQTFADALLFRFPKFPADIQRDFKWLGSYRYGIVHLGGSDPVELRQRCEQASSMLGWPVPYADDAVDLARSDDVFDDWAATVAAERATG